ncbi:MAG: hypothetical protein ACYC46_04385 [Acidobacteriaceae bacterium]
MMNRMPISRWWYVAMFVVLAMLFRSLTPRYELQSAPPASFLAAIPKEIPNGQQLGQQYWHRACVVRWNYQYGHQLPEIPPDAFRLAQTNGASSQEQRNLEMILWRHLQILWLDPEVWTRSYQIQFAWIPQTVNSMANSFTDFVQSIRPS